MPAADFKMLLLQQDDGKLWLHVLLEPVSFFLRMKDIQLSAVHIQHSYALRATHDLLCSNSGREP